jgi:hypothetical protein
MELKANKLYKIVQRKVFTQEECEKIMSVETEPAPFVTYGQLYIFNGEFLEPKKMVGVMTVWPPFLFHHVSPVTKGKRKTLLTFLQGPRCDVYNK